MMYRDFYCMAKDPFAMHPAPDNYFASRSHDQALHLLLENVSQGEPYILVTGEYGVGKTLLFLKLCRFLEKKNDILSVTVSSPTSPFSMLVTSIALQLKVTEVTNSCSSDSQLMEALFNLYISGKIRDSVYIIVDDLQDYEQQMLDHFRHLANFHVMEFYPFRLVCFAYAGFIDELEKKPKYVPFVQRFRRRLHINPLQEDELKEYIYFLMLQAGAKGRPLFDEDALYFLAEESKRIPRLINNLCDRVLLRAFDLGADHIDLEMVRDVCRMVPGKLEGPVQLPGTSNSQGKSSGTTIKKTGSGIDLHMIVQDTAAIEETKEEISSVVVPAPATRRSWLIGILFGAAILIIGFMFLWILSLKLENVSPEYGGKVALDSRNNVNKVTDSVLSAQVTPSSVNNEQISPYSQSGDGKVAGSVTAINTITKDNERKIPESDIGGREQEVSSEKSNPGTFVNIHPIQAVDESTLVSESSALPGARPYVLEIFSGSTPAVTHTELKRLQGKGVRPLFISEVATDPLAPRWNIYLGNFSTEEDARKSTWLASMPEANVRFLPYSLMLVLPEKTGSIEGLQKILETDGYSPWLEYLEDGQQRLLLGVYSSRREAQFWARELQVEGIAAVVVRR